jgi:hypothetical protein
VNSLARDHRVGCRNVVSGPLAAGILIALVLVLPARAGAEDAIGTMREVLTREGVRAFARRIDSAGWEAPKMFSRWYVERHCPAAEKPAALRAREFGLAVADALDVVAPSVLSENGEQLFATCQAMLDLADWLAATPGYGNLLLARRAKDLARVGLQRLVADIRFPFDALEAQVERFLRPVISTADLARVLNEEAGARVFPSATRARDGQAGVWASWLFKLRLSSDANWRRQSGEAKIQEYLRGQDDFLQFEGVDLSPPDLSFFEPDDCPEPRTTSNCWEWKQHEVVAAGAGPLSQQGFLEALAVFRRRVGHFPLVPQETALYGIRVENPGEEAFREAWRAARLPGEDPRYYGTAWMACEQVQKGTLLDSDTYAYRLHEGRVRSQRWNQREGELLRQGIPKAAVIEQLKREQAEEASRRTRQTPQPPEQGQSSEGDVVPSLPSRDGDR